LTWRLLGGAEDDIDRILFRSGIERDVPAAERYHRLMLAAFATVGATPDTPGSSTVETVAGVRVFPLRLARRLVDPEHRVGNPRHIVVYRVASDGIVEIIGLAHDRMLLTRAARRMRRDADR
jgi:toxin ParE1/3/4